MEAMCAFRCSNINEILLKVGVAEVDFEIFCTITRKGESPSSVV
jgi:hypothetical protein